MLPWLALTAQLPFETSSSRSNAMSGLLAVGSPALITYSLTVTILNRSSAYRRFEKLRSDGFASKAYQRYPGLPKTIKEARYLMQEMQQMPMRVYQDEGWLSSLVMLPENFSWWQRVRIELQKARRTVTASLFAQIATAVTGWLMTVISTFVASFGEVDAALQLSNGSVWLWMVVFFLSPWSVHPWMTFVSRFPSFAAGFWLAPKKSQGPSDPHLAMSTILPFESVWSWTTKGIWF